MPKLTHVTQEQENILLEEIRKLHLQTIPSDIVKIKKTISQQTQHSFYARNYVDARRTITIDGLSHSILIANGDWFILSHRGSCYLDEDGKPNYSHPDWLGKGTEHEVRRIYKIEFPQDATQLPSISDKSYIVKKTTNEYKQSVIKYIERITHKSDAIRRHEDNTAIEIWRNPKKDTGPLHPNKNTIHYVVQKAFKGVDLYKYAERRTIESYQLNGRPAGLPIPEGIDMAIAIIEKVKEVHAQGRIHGDLSQHNVLYNEDRKEVRLIDFSLSVPFGEAIRGHGFGLLAPEYCKQYKKNSTENQVLAHPTQDIYALGARSGGAFPTSYSPLCYAFGYIYDDADKKESTFRRWLREFYLDRFVGTIHPERRPTLEEAQTVLTHLKDVYENEVEFQRFQRVNDAFNKIQQKIDALSEESLTAYSKSLRVGDGSFKEKASLLINAKILALRNLQEIIATQFIQCYNFKPGTAEHENALNQFCLKLQQTDWQKETSTNEIYLPRSSKGLVADLIIGATLIGFIAMLIKAIVAALQGKSFTANLCFFSKPDSVGLMEQLTFKDLPIAVR